MLPTVTGVAGGERTGERAGRLVSGRPVFFLHTVSTSTPSRRPPLAQRTALPTWQAAGEHEAAAVRSTRSRSSGRVSVGSDAMAVGDYKATQLLDRKAGGNNYEEASGDEEEEDEEYCWSSESDEDADEGDATMDTAMMETIRVDQRAQLAYVHRQRMPDEGDTMSQASQRPVDYSDAETRSWDRTRAIGSGQRANGSTSLQDNILARISTLKALCDQGFISTDEYERRKSTIMDELTYASRSTDEPTTTHCRKSFRRTEGLPMIVPHAPDFRESVPEVATKHVFNYETREWTSTQVFVNLDETPFSKGSLRVVYHLQDLGGVDAVGGINDTSSRQRRSMSSPPPVSMHKVVPTMPMPSHRKGGTFVAKLAIDPDEDPQTYFRDIELQAHCAFYAQVYNSYHPPKRVEFIKAWVLELTERNGALCAVEPYMPGEYRKHNNNFGSVSDDERNTPQAFSHFTYEASNHELLAVDIQGVGDLYTDPQIHTLNGNDFGKGNLGALGFQKFLSSHRCNSICRYLKLPPVNPKDRHADAGTLPVQELMNRDRVRPTHFDSKHYYENAPMLQKYVAQCRALELQQRHDTPSPPRPSRSLRRWQIVCARLFCGC